MSITNDDVVKALGNLTVMELIALTKELEAKWGVKAEPQVQQQVQQKQEEQKPAQEEFTVVLASVPADKKMSILKAIREQLMLGLKESKDFVEAAPKTVKEGLTRAEADALKAALEAAGAVVEMK